MMDSERLKFWIEFIVHNSGFPLPDRLAAQFEAASFSKFCDCGCNSFEVTVVRANKTTPIAKPNDHSEAVFSSSFFLEPSGKSLELILFANETGDLSYVEIDCNANSEPVPKSIQVSKPYHVHASPGLAP
jgi:hypothetical protein